MASKKPSIILTARDQQILTALLKTPLDAVQLLSLSQTFEKPFSTNRRLRARLSMLVDAGFIKIFKYATAGSGSVNYYKPTKQGYRFIQGPKSELPPRSYFGSVAMGSQEHTRALADFVVKTELNAQQSGVQLGGFYRENQLRLTLGAKTIQPDCAFQLQLPDGKLFNYMIEIDCGTEPVRSTKQRESLEQKIRFYDEYQNQIDKRFRVLVIFTKPSMRMQHFVQIADDVIADPQRTLFCACNLPSYINAESNFSTTLFLDRYGKSVALIPTSKPQQDSSPLRKKELVFLEQ